MDSVKLGILLCIHAGIRTGELSAIKWGDVSLEEQTIHISLTVQRIRDEKDSGHKTRLALVKPKLNSAIRSIPLPDKLCSIMEPLKQDDACFILTGTGMYALLRGKGEAEARARTY